MIKRYLALLVIGICSIFLVGCEEVIDLTDENSRLIAEYAAELLLKYDINYIDRIDEGNDQAKEMATEESQENIEQIEESMSEEISTEKQDGVGNNVEEENTTESVEDEKTIEMISDIAEIAGISDVNITYREYAIMNRYPATDGEGEFIYLEASDGYQLLVLYFDVVNTSDDMIQISMIDKELDYRIVCNGSKAAKPMLTILMDDLGTLEANLEPDKQQEAVLVFQISDDMKEELETMELFINYNDTDNVMKILQ